MTTFSKLLGITVMLGAMASCGGPQGDKAATGEAREISVTTGDVILEANLAASNIEWEGAKPTATHNGTVNLQSGQLELLDGAIIGGTFTIDMNTIKDIDLTDADDNAKLVGHLKSADFFDVEKYPTAVFQITSVEPLSGNADANHTIFGNLTMKDVTKSIAFPAMITMDELSVTATSPPFVLDRTQWNVQYGSKTLFKNLKDKFINDEMSLRINFNATL